MIWLEILKPSRLKVIVTFVLAAVTALVIYRLVGIMVDCIMNWGCDTLPLGDVIVEFFGMVLVGPVYYLLGLLGLASYVAWNFSYNTHIGYFIFGFFEIVYLYFLVCVIVQIRLVAGEVVKVKKFLPWIFGAILIVPELIFWFTPLTIINLINTFLGLKIPLLNYSLVGSGAFEYHYGYIVFIMLMEWLGGLGLLVISIKHRKKMLSVVLAVIFLWLSFMALFGNMSWFIDFITSLFSSISYN